MLKTLYKQCKKTINYIPSDTSAVLKNLLYTTKQHAKHGLLDVLMAMN